MTFHMDLIKECFATWVHLRILETLMSEPRSMSQRQLARRMGIPRATAQRVLNNMGETGLIKPHKTGSATYWEIDKQGYLYGTIRPVLEGLGTITPPLRYLKNLVRKIITLPKGTRCLVFGSTNEGNDTPSSDIDMAIILPDGLKIPPQSLKKELDTLHDLCREKFSKRLAPVFVSEKNLRSRNKELYRSILKGVEVSS